MRLAAGVDNMHLIDEATGRGAVTGARANLAEQTQQRQIGQTNPTDKTR